MRVTFRSQPRGIPIPQPRDLGAEVRHVAETFHDSPSPKHPVRYRSKGDEPDAWLSVEDAQARLRRYFDSPDGEYADVLLAGHTIATAFVIYSIPREEWLALDDAGLTIPTE